MEARTAGEAGPGMPLTHINTQHSVNQAMPFSSNIDVIDEAATRINWYVIGLMRPRIAPRIHRGHALFLRLRHAEFLKLHSPIKHNISGTKHFSTLEPTLRTAEAYLKKLIYTCRGG